MRIQRRSDLITEEIDDEALVLDEVSGAIHCLKPLAARLWKACEHGASIEELSAVRGDAGEAELDAALRGLFNRGLLEPVSTSPSSRRHFLRKASATAVATGTGAVLTLFSRNAAAASCARLLQPCGGGVVCCSGLGLGCVGGMCINLSLEPSESPPARPRRR